MAAKKFGIKRKVSDFLQLEDGNVGKKNVLTAGTLVGASILGQMLFAALDANAGVHVDNPHENFVTHSQSGGWNSAL